MFDYDNDKSNVMCHFSLYLTVIPGCILKIWDVIYHLEFTSIMPGTTEGLTDFEMDSFLYHDDFEITQIQNIEFFAEM